MKSLRNILLMVLVVLAGAGVYLLYCINDAVQYQADATCNYPSNTLSITYEENAANYADAQEKYKADKKKTLDILSEAGIVITSSSDTVRLDKGNDVTLQQGGNTTLEGMVDIDVQANDRIFDVMKKLTDNDIDVSYSTAAASDDCMEQPAMKKAE